MRKIFLIILAAIAVVTMAAAANPQIQIMRILPAKYPKEIVSNPVIQTNGVADKQLSKATVLKTQIVMTDETQTNEKHSLIIYKLPCCKRQLILLK